MVKRMLTYRFMEETEGIYRLRVPFDNIYTSVFLVGSEEGFLLVDCATTDEDVDEIILPALAERGLRPCDLRGLVLTHHHSDHDGGRKRFLEHCPTLEIIDCQNRPFLVGIAFPRLTGHTRDSIGVYVEKSGTLIGGDGLQGDGVGKYRRTLEDEVAYLDTLEKLTLDEGVKVLLFSHAYEPWNADSAFGREQVLSCLMACKESLMQGKRQE